MSKIVENPSQKTDRDDIDGEDDVDSIGVCFLADLMSGVESGPSNVAQRVLDELALYSDIDLTAIHPQNIRMKEDNVVETERGYTEIYTNNVIERLRSISPDIVFVHAFNTGLFDELEKLSRELTGTKFVYRHGTNLCEQWLIRPTNGVDRRIPYLVSDLDWFDCIVAPTETATDRLKFIYGEDVPSLWTIPVSIEYDKYIPTPIMDDDKLKVVMASRITPNNYVLAPLLAISKLLQQDKPLALNILGGGMKRCNKTVRDITQQYSNDDIAFVGQQDPETTRNILQESDVLCIPSIDHQSVATVGAEALASGCLVLTGNYETTRHEDQYINVTNTNPRHWKMALQDIMENRDQAVEKARQNIEKAKRYDVRLHVKQGYHKLFKKLMGENIEIQVGHGSHPDKQHPTENK